MEGKVLVNKMSKTSFTVWQFIKKFGRKLSKIIGEIDHKSQSFITSEIAHKPDGRESFCEQNEQNFFQRLQMQSKMQMFQYSLTEIYIAHLITNHPLTKTETTKMGQF